jgi:predicted dehydrogenase
MEVVSVCDPNPAMREKVAEKFPEASFYLDLGDMLAKEKLDFAVVASPHHLHARLTIQCLEAGVDVMVEKPMATTYEDCRAMIAAAEGAGRMLTVFHNRRLDSWYVAAKMAVEDGKLGHLVELRAMWLNPPAWKAGRSWRAFKQSSGGLMYDWGAHLIDNVVHFANSPVVSVSGYFYRRPDADPALNEDHGHIQIRFKSGVIGHVVISDVDREPKYRYTLVGQQATLVDQWNWSGGAAKIYTGEGREPYAVEEIPYGNDKNSAPDFYTNLAAHYKDGAPVMVTPESAALVIKILNAADESHARGGVPITFD